MFLMFGSLDERTDLSVHPKYQVIFNNVSKYGDNYDPVKITNKDPDYDPFKETPELAPEKRIQDLKS